MEWLESLILGVVQGVTEFLPVSSDGHLLVTQQFFAWLTGDRRSGQENIFFDVMLHIGTVAAILVFYRRAILEGARGLLRDDPDVAPGFDRASIVRDLLPGSDVDLPLADNTFTELVGWFDNPGREALPVRLTATAGDELAILLNGQPLAEAISVHETTRYAFELLLPAGPTMLRVAHHQMWKPGRLVLTSSDPDGRPIPWRCNAPAG